MSVLTMKISQTLFNELQSTFNLELLSQYSKAKGFKYKNVIYVATSSVSSFEKGTICISCNIAVPLDYYKGNLVHLEQDAHRDQINKGTRPRGYTGMIVFVEEKKMVMCDKIDFFPIRESNKQLEFF